MRPKKLLWNHSRDRVIAISLHGSNLILFYHYSAVKAHSHDGEIYVINSDNNKDGIILIKNNVEVVTVVFIIIYLC